MTVQLSLNKQIHPFPEQLLRVVTRKEYDLEARVLNKSKYDDYVAQESSSKSSKSDSKPQWIVPNLRVQIYDKKFKYGSKYHKEKVVITEVDGKRCKVVTRSKEELKDVHQSSLRTVIPKDQKGEVMILTGPYRQKMGKLIDVDRKRETCQVKLIGFIAKPLNLTLDDVCEVVE